MSAVKDAESEISHQIRSSALYEDGRVQHKRAILSCRRNPHHPFMSLISQHHLTLVISVPK